MEPKVSVVIPTYNYGEFIGEAIESVLAQTFLDFELIIVDNSSTDNTEQIVKRHLSDKRIRYYKNASNIGFVRNFNKCLEYSKGAYIKFLMADDKFHPQLLEKYVAIMDSYPKVSLVTAYRKFFGINAEVKQDYPPFTGLKDGKKVIYASLNTHNWIGEPSTVMFRRSNLWNGTFDSQYGWVPDWDMWIRQLLIGDCYIIPETLSYFRQHKKQVTVNATKTYRRFFEEYRFYNELKKNNKYQLDLSQIYNLDKIIKRKATICSTSAIKLVPKLYKRTNWQLFINGIKITFRERVYFGLSHQ